MTAKWFYFQDKKRTGPVTAKELRVLAKQGLLKATDLVLREDLQKPILAGKVQGLFESHPSPAKPRKTEHRPEATSGPVRRPPTEWFFGVDGEQRGPVSWAELLAMCDAGKLMSDTLVWNRTLPSWIAAGEVPQLKSKFTTSTSAEAASPKPGGSVFKSLLNDAGQSLKRAWNETTAPVADRTDSSANTTPPANPATAASRLPSGVNSTDVVAHCQVEYQGGHPTHTNKANGELILTRAAVFFLDNQQAADFSIPSSRILDIPTPGLGEFPQQMIQQSKAMDAMAGMGKHFAAFAGSMMGGTEGTTLRALSSTAASVAAEKSRLGPPPKNRLIVIALEGATRYQVIFDTSGPNKSEIEKQADVFWRKVAVVRAEFAGTARRPQTPAAPATTTTSVKDNAGFWVLRDGVRQGPISPAVMQQMISNGDLGFNDLIRVETWVPVSLVAMMLPLNLAAIQSGPGFSQNSQGPEGNPQSGSRPSQPSAKSQSSGRVAAAGVGGLLAGAAAMAMLKANSAQAGESDHASSGGRVVHLDRDGDGVIDAAAIDRNGDGRIDAMALDRDHDGKFETVGIDSDNDGRLDTFGLDQDGDGDVDIAGQDYDQDGEIDAFAYEDD